MAGTKSGHDEGASKFYDINRSIFSSRAILAP
jgi:hypothetical protein